MEKGDYALDRELADARRRLEVIQRIEDPATIATLEAIGVVEGWRCLELGAGGGSIAAWLCDRVGAAGRVVAADIEPRLLRVPTRENLEVRRHDARKDPLEQAAFDLVHARNLLVHLPERETVLRTMVEALKPGGWILVEEADVVTEVADPTVDDARRALHERGLEAIRGFIVDHGLDPWFGRRLYGLLRSLGLEELRAEGRTQMLAGGPHAETPHKGAYRQLKPQIVATGRIPSDDYDAFLALYDDPAFAWRETLRMSVRARRRPAPLSKGSLE